MLIQPQLEELEKELQEKHNFSKGSISFLLDKGFTKEDFQKLYEILNFPDQTFAERRKIKSDIEKMIEESDSEEITTGRYNRYVKTFKDISSEQALVRERMKFAVEYAISLADLLSNYPEYSHLVKKPFSEEEKIKLRSIYKNFRTKDFAVVKIIENRTNHDIVAANTWVTIRAQQLGLDENLLRGLVHLARTSEDVNSNAIGKLYMDAIGQWALSTSKFLLELEKRAISYAEITCVGETHGQKAQLTTLGHIFANLGEQIRQHANCFLKEEKLRLEGKISGAIGTDVDMKVAFPNIDPTPMYKHIVEDVFGLKYVELGNDQSSTYATLSQALDTMANVDTVVLKTAVDIWEYAQRGILSKKTRKGESGSSVMPQKANPYLAEGCEALISIYTSMIDPIKKMLIAYREQGDLRRSITCREGFHPIMLSIIAKERLINELNNYEPNIIAIEEEIYKEGPKVISSALQTKLRERGVPDAYDRIKNVVMKPYVKAEEIKLHIDELVGKNVITREIGKKLENWLYSVIDTQGLMKKLYETSDAEKQKEIIEKLNEKNKDETRRELLGNAIYDTYRMISRIEKARKLLMRYAN